uniref:Hypothethical protein (Modular protein) n=1 Tax=Ralstonia solanacearum TaxID=305 RepID=A0A0S4XGQ9_RALSL|nr:Hypothethical protein (modular protein) [Ralstonia solanacearum]
MPVPDASGDTHEPQEHDLPVVRRRRCRRRHLLRRDPPRQRCRCGPPRAGRLSGRQAGRCLDGRVHRCRHSLPRAERRPAFQAQRGFLVSNRDGRPGRNRPPVECDRRQWRPGKRMRLVQGPLGHLVADHPARPHCGDMRPRSRGSQARIRRDDDDEKDRYRHDRGSAAGPRPIPELMERAAHMRFRSDQGGGWSTDSGRQRTTCASSVSDRQQQ